MKNTTNYNLPKYEANDNPNLLDGYNNAMDKIDNAMKANKDSTSKFTSDISTLKAQMDATTTSGLKTLINEDVTAIHQIDADQDTLINNNAADITKVSNRVSELEEKPYLVVIGDSFSADSQSGTPLWYTYYAAAKGYQVYTNASDGMGFISGTDNNFYQQCVKAKNALDTSKVAEVIVFGGLNDINGTMTSNSISTAIEQVCNYLKTNFTSSAIWFVGPESFPTIGYSNFRSDNTSKGQDFTQWLAFKALSNGFKYSNPVVAFNYLNGFFGGKTGTNPHPSAIGEKIIAAYMLNGGKFDGTLLGFYLTGFTSNDANIKFAVHDSALNEVQGAFSSTTINVKSDTHIQFIATFDTSKLSANSSYNISLPQIRDLQQFGLKVAASFLGAAQNPSVHVDTYIVHVNGSDYVTYNTPAEVPSILWFQADFFV